MLRQLTFPVGDTRSVPRGGTDRGGPPGGRDCPGVVTRGQVVIPEFCLMLATYGPQAHGVSLTDLGRFPSYEVAVASRDFASRHLAWLVFQKEPLDYIGREHMRAWSGEHRRIYRAWSDLAYALQPELKDEVRLAHLISLKHLLVDKAYYAGRMPPCCPWWRFEER